MATTLEIIRGISQAASNAHDGAIDEKGEPIKVGLKREEGHPLLDKRVMDGFSVKFHGPLLCIHYHTEVNLKDVHGKSFEGEIGQTINAVAKFLKKEYKKVTGNALTLTKEGDAHVHLEYISRIRCWATSYCYYKIGGIKDVEGIKKSSEEQLKESMKEWMAGRFDNE